jgi:hypothetical protein
MLETQVQNKKGTYMRDSLSKLWHRCGTCGTIFSEMEELQEHMASHDAKKRLPEASGATVPSKRVQIKSVASTPVASKA